MVCSVEIYQMCDDVLLLRTGGFPVYLGETAAADAYFTTLGFPLPPNTNPADHQMDVVSGRVPLRVPAVGAAHASDPAAAGDSKEANTPLPGTGVGLSVGTAAGAEAPVPALVAIEDRDVPHYLSDAWLNFRQTFASGKAAIEHDTAIRCTQAQ
jgi:hypothetical protein